MDIGLGDLVNAALQTIRSDLGALRAVDKSLANVSHVEHGRGLDIVPVLAGKRVDTEIGDERKQKNKN